MELRQGIDLVHIGRFQSTAENESPSVFRKIFTPGEHAYCKSMRLKYEHYAARFAAKKAVLKALGIKKSGPKLLQGIEVCRYPSGKPYFRFSESSLRGLKLPGRFQVELSIAHEREYAVASVIFVFP